MDIENWRVSDHSDPMDDALFRTAITTATSITETALGDGKLVFRARIFTRAIRPELYFGFDKKAFSKRSEEEQLRVRLDRDPPVSLKFNPSDTASAAFVTDPALIYLPMVKATEILVEIPTLSKGTIRLQFNVAGFKNVLTHFINHMIDFDVENLLDFNPSIVDGVLRRGDKNLSCIVDALNAKRALNKLESYRQVKRLDIFEAVQKFAVDNRASEIFGLFESRGGRPNMGWQFMLSESAPQRVKEAWGPLFISD